MPSPKDGKAGVLVPPSGPVQATNADDAQPGEVENIKAAQRETRSGKYGSTPVTPYVKPAPEPAPASSAGSPSAPPEKKTWIEIHLLDMEGEPVAGEPYEVTLPDQSVATGTTDANGKGRVDGFSPGQCKVTFPNLDKTVVNPQ